MYTQTTWGQAQADLAARLQDSGQQQWSGPALSMWLTEALRVWNAFTLTWRTDFVLPLTTATNWYDLSAQPGSPLSRTVTIRDLVQEICYHLLEPLPLTYPMTWSGSSQFNLSDILRALQTRRDETLGTTGCVVGFTSIGAPIQLTGVQLPGNTLVLRRVRWVPEDPTFSPSVLRQADQWAKTFYDRGFTTTVPGTPRTWLASTEPPLTFDVDRVPADSGNYQLLTITAGGVVTGTSAELVGLPDDWTWVAKYGALASLLAREGNAKDVPRAEYAAARFQQGLKLLAAAPVVATARMNNVPVRVDGVRNADDYARGWETTPPRAVYTTGQLVGVGETNTPGAFSPSLNLVSNAPVGGNYIQCAPDVYPLILDYAQHVASFQIGGTEFTATEPLFRGFMQAAALTVAKLNALGEYPRTMWDVSQIETQRNPIAEE